MAEKLTPLVCTSCQRQNVQPRRRSKYGVNYCKDPVCQSAKVKFYREQALRDSAPREVAEKQRWEQAAKDVTDLLVAALANDRIHCPDCGLTTALATFSHPQPDGQRCFGTGGATRLILTPAVLAVWPEDARTYEAVSA